MVVVQPMPGKDAVVAPSFRLQIWYLYRRKTHFMGETKVYLRPVDKQTQGNRFDIIFQARFPLACYPSRAGLDQYQGFYHAIGQTNCPSPRRQQRLNEWKQEQCNSIFFAMWLDR